MSERPSLISRVFGSRGLKGISEIRTFFRTNEQPIFFIGPTAFNLLGIDRWVRGFEYVVYYDSWDGAHPRVFTPASKPFVEFYNWNVDPGEMDGDPRLDNSTQKRRFREMSKVLDQVKDCAGSDCP